MNKVYDFGRWHFESQTDLEHAVKERIRDIPVDQRFRDDLLIDVINELHPDVIAARQSVVALEFLSYSEQRLRGMASADLYRGGKVMMGYFEPLGEWRDVTVYPWRRSKHQTEIKQAFRAIVAPYLPKPTPDNRCVMPDCSANWKTLEYQHVAPTFDEIATRCLSFCTVDEIAIRFGYNKFTSKPTIFSVADVIPATHPAVIELLRSHQSNQWAWLCPEHHRGVSPSVTNETVTPQIQLTFTKRTQAGS